MKKYDPIEDRFFSINEVDLEERYYSENELDELLDRAFSEGYEYAQREFVNNRDVAKYTKKSY